MNSFSLNKIEMDVRHLDFRLRKPILSGNPVELQKSIDENTDSVTKNDALLAACIFGRVELVYYLLKIGADASKTDKMPPGSRYDSVTPIHAAVLNGNLENSFKIIRLLIEHGADVNARSIHHNITPLACACLKGKLDIVKLFLKPGADFRFSEYPDNENLLHIAIRSAADSNIYINHLIRFLVQQGVDIDKLNAKGQSPVQIAYKKDAFEIVKCLVEEGADISKPYVFGFGLYAVACSTFNLPMILALSATPKQKIERAFKLA